MRRLAAFLALVSAATLSSCGKDRTVACTADEMIGPNGERYGRDPTQECKFVDGNGNVVPNQK